MKIIILSILICVLTFIVGASVGTLISEFLRKIIHSDFE